MSKSNNKLLWYIQTGRILREAKYIKMPRVHLWNFECIDGVYGKANNTIYYLGVPMPSFDYATFETIK